MECHRAQNGWEVEVNLDISWKELICKKQMDVLTLLKVQQPNLFI
jgi:hypothetical protein